MNLQEFKRLHNRRCNSVSFQDAYDDYVDKLLAFVDAYDRLQAIPIELDSKEAVEYWRLAGINLQLAHAKLKGEK